MVGLVIQYRMTIHFSGLLASDYPCNGADFLFTFVHISNATRMEITISAIFSAVENTTIQMQ